MTSKLGQYFLQDKKKIKEIVDALDLKAGDVVIEIGPGHGEVTHELRTRNGKLKIIAIEKDRKLAENLKQAFSNDKKLKIIEGDALKILPFLIRNSKSEILNYKLVGNIPYYLTGYLFRIISALPKKPQSVVFTVQKEVAQKICAVPPAMNLLAASVQFWAEPKLIDFISKTSFRPTPQVDSAIIGLKTASSEEKSVKKYYHFIKILFRQPRKTIFNNLRAARIAPERKILTLLQENNINDRLRPQNLSLKTIKKLALMLYND